MCKYSPREAIQPTISCSASSESLKPAIGKKTEKRTYGCIEKKRKKKQGSQLVSFPGSSSPLGRSSRNTCPQSKGFTWPFRFVSVLPDLIYLFKKKTGLKKRSSRRSRASFGEWSQQSRAHRPPVCFAGRKWESGEAGS